MQHDNTVFVVDPDKAIGDEVTALLGVYDTSVQVFTNAEDFLKAYPAEGIGTCCLLVEAELPGISGLLLLQRLRARGFDQPVIFLTGTVNRELRRQAMEAGATVVVEKPVVHAFLVVRLSELCPGESYGSAAAAKGLELRDGTLVTFRIMRPEDAEIEQQFVRDMSPLSKHMRFFSPVVELSPAMLEQFTHPQYPHTYALIATVSEAGREREIAVVRYEPAGVDGVVEFAIAVADAWHGFGLASEMLRGLTAAAAVAGKYRLEAPVLRENHRMLTFVKALGFTTSGCEEDPTLVCVSKELRPIPPVESELVAEKPNG